MTFSLNTTSFLRQGKARHVQKSQIKLAAGYNKHMLPG